MDRDKRWERVQVAFDALVSGKGEESADFLKTVNEKYQKDETDEFLKPLILNKEGLVGGLSIFFNFFSGLAQFSFAWISLSHVDDDTMLFFNYRSDRMREIVESFGFEDRKFTPERVPKNLV